MSKTPVVCDNGTGFVKLGYAGQYFPEYIFASMVGTPTMKYSEEFENVDLKKVVVGDEAQKYRHMLEVKYPVSEGRILYWKGDYSIHHIWDYAFNEKLQVGEKDRSDHNILLTEAPNNPLSNKKRMLEAMLETYGWAGTACAMQAILVLYAQGLVTGAVLDAGDGVSHCIPVWEGVMLADQIKRLNVAGRSVTERLVKLLQARGFNFHRSADMDTVRQIKEKFCYVGYDLNIENKLALDTTCLTKKYRLPDGRQITIGAERFQAPEVLFQPHLGDEKYAEQKGIHEMVYDMIMGCSVDLRRDFFKRIVLSGGSTMYPGLPTRLEKEISNLVLTKNFNGDKSALKKFKLKVEDPPRRKYMVFLGGAVLADLMKDTESFWISQKEWAEKGAERLAAEKNW